MTAEIIPRGNAPTEAEIRQAIEDRVELTHADAGQLIYDFLGVIHYVPPKDRGPNYGGCLWDDLSPGKAAVLEARVDQVYDLVDPIERMIVDAVTTAALAFAAEYPDAPRAKHS